MLSLLGWVGCGPRSSIPLPSERRSTRAACQRVTAWAKTRLGAVTHAVPPPLRHGCAWLPSASVPDVFGVSPPEHQAALGDSCSGAGYGDVMLAAALFKHLPHLLTFWAKTSRHPSVGRFVLLFPQLEKG